MMQKQTDTPQDSGLRTISLFAGIRIQHENMEGEVESNPDYIPSANFEDYSRGRLPLKCLYEWVVRSGTDGFYPESVLAHGGKLAITNSTLIDDGAGG